jgi:hypothetical protein
MPVEVSTASFKNTMAIQASENILTDQVTNSKSQLGYPLADLISGFSWTFFVVCVSTAYHNAADEIMKKFVFLTRIMLG